MIDAADMAAIVIMAADMAAIVTMAADMAVIATMAADMAAITSTAARITIGTTTGEATAVEGGIPTSNAAARVRTPSFCMVFGRNMSAEAGRRCANPTNAHGCRKKRLIR